MSGCGDVASGGRASVECIGFSASRQPVAAAPGIFYVFRDEADAQSFAVNRVSRPRRIPGIEKSQALVADHKELIEPLIAFVTDRGRLPVDGELPAAPQLTAVFGSVARAFSLLRRVTSADRWDRIRQERRADVLVYLALARPAQDNGS